MATEAAQSRKTSAFTPSTGLQSNDAVGAVTLTAAAPNNVIVTIQTLLANSQGDHVVQPNFDLRFGNSNTPANSTAIPTVVKNSIWADSDYIYVATANGTVKRAVLNSF